ncbi:PAS domain-containing protein [Sphingomonas sp. BN140010]|uniref:histidine kinase n=1 Tax=Sphingomonas arvum TaxID=2992113 RepID=A0ABT3JG67_9SPHN|nr:PAS domain-containing protein [Sphingomonas sp. BN140010]MCW3798069.1 PAS domain-containing protein [Sphingomonas sp. BN140010]
MSSNHLFARGVMGALMRNHDWSSSSLGPPERWPASLRAIVALLLNSRFPMFVAWGPELAFLYNDPYAQVLGSKHPEALGRPFRDIWAEIWPDISPLINAALAGEASFREDLPLLMNRRGYDEQTWFTFSYSPVFDDDGQVAGMFCTCTETTEAVLLRGQQEEERKRLARMFEQAPGFITILGGPDHEFEFVNATYKRLFGEREYVGNTVRDVFPELQEQEFFSLLDTVFRSGQRFVAERVPIRIGSDVGEALQERLLDFIYEPLTDGSGQVTGIFVEGHDVTAQHSAVEALRESEARLRALTDNLPGGSVYQMSGNADGSDRRFTYLSQSHERMSGLTVEQVMGDPTLPYQMLVEEDRERFLLASAQAIQTCSRFEIEVRFHHANGEVRWAHLRSEPRPQPDGTVVWDGIQVDITERKRAEESLRELNNTLEQRVAERTAELERAHEQLRQSQKMEAMGALTGGVAHDFNNLLSPIIGSLDLLQRKQVGDERERRLIDGALQSAERARVLVQRLLAFARRQPLQPRPVEVGDLVEGMVNLIASTSGPQIKVKVEISEALPPAIADANQIEMAVLNLCVNARDAMPDGGVLRLSVNEHGPDRPYPPGLAPGRYICLSVSDTGNGMDAPTRERAIEPFFSTKGVGQGTGLGLSMVHGLASQLGGVLTIESAPGVGTNVEVWLPATSAAQMQVATKPEAEPVRSTGGRALLVDDEELVRVSTAHMLAQLGYTVVEAASAAEALPFLRESGSIDLLVTDHLMPGMNGSELARLARANDPDLKVLLVSGYAEADGVAPDLVRLVKPFREEELAAKIAEVDELKPS